MSVIAVLSRVSSTASSISVISSLSTLVRSPMTRILTPAWCSSARSRRMKRFISPIRSSISSTGRDQFSDEKL